MNSHSSSGFLVLIAAIVACGGGNGSSNPIEGGSSDGAIDSNGGVGIDAAAAVGRTDGTVPVDASSTKVEAANVDQASTDLPIDAQTCPTVASSCGGNIVGTWHPVSVCSTSDVAMPACAAPGFSTDRSKDNTTYTFNADGSFTYASSGTTVETTRYPLECINNGANVGIVQACANHEASFRSSLEDGPTPPSVTNTYACAVDANQLCVCTLSTMYSRLMTGTYAIAGSGISFTVKAVLDLDGGAVDAGTMFTGLELPTTYCVSDDTLVLFVLGLTGARTWTTLNR